MLGVAEADLQLEGGFVRMKGAPGMPQIARRACGRERSAFQGFTMARRRVARGPGALSSPQTGDCPPADKGQTIDLPATYNSALSIFYSVAGRSGVIRPRASSAATAISENDGGRAPCFSFDFKYAGKAFGR
jgi:hypothetical protein